MKSALKWIGVILALLLTAFISFIVLQIASNRSVPLTQFQEWKYNRLKAKFETANDKESLYKKDVLQACTDYFPTEYYYRRTEAYHCFESVFADQKRDWAHLTGYETQKLTAVTLWSANTIYSNERVLFAQFEPFCVNGEISISWIIDDNIRSGTNTINYQIDYATSKSINVDFNVDRQYMKIQNRKETAEFVEETRSKKKLRINYTNKDGIDREFRFDISKFHSELAILEKVCAN